MATEKQASFPQFKNTPTTKRTIVGPMYDGSGDEDESEYSFVHPYGEKRCHIRRTTMIDRIATNLKDVQHFGNAVRQHVDRKINQLIEEDYESDSSKEGISKSRTINFMFDKATGCAANLRSVAGEIGEVNPCGGVVAASGDDSQSEHDRRPRNNVKSKIPSPVKIVHKKASKAVIHNGFLTDDITDSDAEFYSDEDSLSGSGSSWASSDESSYESSYESMRRATFKAELQRKKQQFIRRRALERAAAESDSEDEESMDERVCHPMIDNNASQSFLHLKESRPKYYKSASFSDSHPESFGSIDAVEVNTGTSNLNGSDDIGINNSPTLKQLNWKSEDATVVIGDLPLDFLTSSHIGPVMTKLTRSTLDEVLQLGDVIIRINGELDCSTLDAQFVAEILVKCKGKSIRLTYLRKTMTV